jgi:hypothetical protein
MKSGSVGNVVVELGPVVAVTVVEAAVVEVAAGGRLTVVGRNGVRVSAASSG